MCGFVGYLNPKGGQSAAEMDALVLAMAETIAYRGPDDAGSWCDPETGVALGHRRLSIIDLSPMGRQPMVSADGRYVIIYNGEIYNFPEIRAELEGAGVCFRGHSDTEVILEAWAAWGGARTVKRMLGMFALALWDRRERRLTLVRDRLGIKPVYWGWNRGVLFFGSQPGPFTKHPGWRGEIDRDALCAFVRHGYVPAPHSIYGGIEKLEPGVMVDIAADGAAVKTRYWDMRSLARREGGLPVATTDAAATDALEDLLKDAIGRRMVADVPLGAFLSGGIDSSTVVALMQAQSARPVKTFSIGFHEHGYDEARHAKAVAAHLGTEHTELYVDPGHARDALAGMATWYDEPFADSSQVPTYLVSEMTRRHVTVSLSGDGGDELFGGYNRYFLGAALWRRFGHWPGPLRGLVAGGLKTLTPSAWNTLLSVLPDRIRPPQVGDKIHKLADILSLDSQQALYLRLVSQWGDPAALVPGAREPRGLLWDETVHDDVPDFVERMQYLDTVTYLPDDILTKVDRASMAVSLEARVPLLDHRVVEFAWGLPKHQKIRGGEGKWLLRQVLYRHVPKKLMARPKMGFGVPIDSWLRHELRDWAEAMLSENRLRDEGFFDPTEVRKIWSDHLSGKCNAQYVLWNILQFQSWKQAWVG
ncbi:asparagine synthase (glutamine-hydrolyzing) [Varunaivibrio sulfuroxidans]|uniref:asparagine synthase (glutamine-hydrolyzing) n=1 Tax=Varunaivibrio sulfuroxidans TaxID=1773489 RepID=A0A4R3JF49_9PROT|nr:asparagine synthase (glutamine-hydrolyzing) [Varunaivibrio sulfuroxidans]TCS64718.1 asparagine synthase (glutamine-hydrolysing) [Varunaivibrio sulfuroxidans]WES29976.1 asparagine synthase (glutamine-hydrolyzing) [Varunaivibrio sulfuroxidans]